jgi:hypothetical protein
MLIFVTQYGVSGAGVRVEDEGIPVQATRDEQVDCRGAVTGSRGCSIPIMFYAQAVRIDSG